MQFSYILALQALASAVCAVPSFSIEQRATTPEFAIVGEPLQQTAVPTVGKHNHEKRYTPSAVPTDYVSQVLMHHNVHRSNHTAISMTYSLSLANSASILASSCKYGHNTTIGGGGYGQNIAAVGSTASNYGSKSASSVAAYAITEQWYNGEINAFLPEYYGKPTPDMTYFANWGHMSQVVWNSSITVGCATQYCPAGSVFQAPFVSWYTVCNYGPPGNVSPLYNKNIFQPPKGGNATVHATF